MSKLVPSVELKKADGKPIKFNFQFENGLPMMPLINVSEAEIWHTENWYGISVYIDNKSAKKIKDFEVLSISFHSSKEVNKENIWIHLSREYVIISGVSKVTTKLLRKNPVGVLFYNQEKENLN